MHTIDTTFIKLDNDETCALLKPWVPERPPIIEITNEITKIFDKYPEIRKRVVAKLGLTGELSL